MNTNNKNYKDHLKEIILKSKILILLLKIINFFLKFCREYNLCNNYNMRLPAFLTERFTSYWFDQFEKKTYLTHGLRISFYYI